MTTILVTYATSSGSTKEVAEAIANTLQKNRHLVECQPMANVNKVVNYDAVCLGSAVQNGNWLPDAISFVNTHQDQLKLMPVALFTVHIQNTGNDESSRQNRLAYLNEIRPLIHPISEGFFAGKFNRHAAKSFLPNWVTWFIPPIDLRKWGKIHNWAKELSQLLVHQMETDF